MAKLQKFWHAWRRFGQLIGDWVARLVLSIFYFTIYVPFALLFRLRKDPLAIKDRQSPHWQERHTNEITISESRRLS